MIRTAIVFVLSVALGGSIVYTLDRWPRTPDSYEITTKSPCLTRDGFRFTLHYRGIGVATFHVHPPQTP